jgi:hypothetical protein
LLFLFCDVEVLPLNSTSLGVKSALEERTMKRKKFGEERIIGVLKEAEAGAKVRELCSWRAAASLRRNRAVDLARRRAAPIGPSARGCAG